MKSSKTISDNMKTKALSNILQDSEFIIKEKSNNMTKKNEVIKKSIELEELEEPGEIEEQKEEEEEEAVAAVEEINEQKEEEMQTATSDHEQSDIENGKNGEVKKKELKRQSRRKSSKPKRVRFVVRENTSDIETKEEATPISVASNVEEKPAAATTEKVVAVKHRRLHRFKPGTVALREIRKYQKTAELIIPRLPFNRIVREILQDLSFDKYQFRLQRAALEALQEAAENHLVRLINDSYLITCYAAKRVTLFPKDMQLVKRLQQI